ncbi:hypothetical protein FACS189454_07250 [Planctomycetales bacterium]|nr:hypothetical protein FACS189454_07250 [Planctomycetales bacterium]
MIFRTFFTLGFLASGGILIGLWFFAYEDHSAEVSGVVQLLRVDRYKKNFIEPDSQLARLALKRKDVARKLLEAGKMQVERKKDLSKLQNEMFAALAKTKVHAEDARKRFEGGKVFGLNEPLGRAYHKWKEAQTVAEGLARVNRKIEEMEKFAPLSEFTSQIKTLIQKSEEHELFISPDEQNKIDRLLATGITEPTPEDITESEKVQDLIWGRVSHEVGENAVSGEQANNQNMLEQLKQYAGIDGAAGGKYSGGDVSKYVIRPKWFKQAFITNVIVFAVCFPVVIVVFMSNTRKRIRKKKRDEQIRKEQAKREQEEKERDEQIRRERAKKEQEEREQVRAAGEIFGELLVLFSESERYHRSTNPAISDALRHVCELVQFTPNTDLMDEQNVAAVLKIIDDLYQWQKEYSRQNDVRRIDFLRPDSWIRFQSQFPNQIITKELQSRIV